MKILRLVSCAPNCRWKDYVVRDSKCIYSTSYHQPHLNLPLPEPYITWGTPNLKSVRELVYKRGFVKVRFLSRYVCLVSFDAILIFTWAEVCQHLILGCWRISCPITSLSISYIAHLHIGAMSGKSLIQHFRIIAPEMLPN